MMPRPTSCDPGSYTMLASRCDEGYLRSRTAVRECLLEVVAQVVVILDADAQADQAVVDAPRPADLGRDAGVRHGRGMTDQRLDPAEALGQAEETGPRQQPARGLGSTGQADADHAAEVAH